MVRSAKSSCLNSLAGLTTPSAALRWLRDFLLTPHLPLPCEEGNVRRSNTHETIAYFSDAGDDRRSRQHRLWTGPSLSSVRYRSGWILVPVRSATGCRFRYSSGRTRRLRRCSHQRGGPFACAGVERVALDPTATSVRRIRNAVCLLRPGVFPRLGRT